MLQAMTDQENQPHDYEDRNGCSPEQPREYRRVAVVMGTQPQTIDRYREADRTRQPVEHWNGDSQQDVSHPAICQFDNDASCEQSE